MFNSSRLRNSIGYPLGLQFGSLLASRRLQHGFRSSQDGSKTTQGASKIAPSTPKTPPRLSKSLQDGSVSLQDGSVSLQDVSKSSPEEVFETPSCLKELSGEAFQASSLESLCCKC